MGEEAALSDWPVGMEYSGSGLIVLWSEIADGYG